MPKFTNAQLIVNYVLSKGLSIDEACTQIWIDHQIIMLDSDKTEAKTILNSLTFG